MLRPYTALVKRRRKWSKKAFVAVLVLLTVGVLLVPRVVDWAREERIQGRMAAHAALIERHAAAADLPVELVRAVVRVESSGNPRAVSNKAARGLMQITPITHEEVQRRFGLADGDLFDPDYNLRVGTIYLRYLLDRFDADLTLALAAYHMGPTRVASLRRKHPQLSSEELVKRFAGPQTRAYVRRVEARL